MTQKLCKCPERLAIIRAMEFVHVYVITSQLLSVYLDPLHSFRMLFFLLPVCCTPSKFFANEMLLSVNS